MPFDIEEQTYGVVIEPIVLHEDCINEFRNVALKTGVYPYGIWEWIISRNAVIDVAM